MQKHSAHKLDLIAPSWPSEAADTELRRKCRSARRFWQSQTSANLNQIDSTVYLIIVDLGSSPFWMTHWRKTTSHYFWFLKVNFWNSGFIFTHPVLAGLCAASCRKRRCTQVPSAGCFEVKKACGDEVELFQARAFQASDWLVFPSVLCLSQSWSQRRGGSNACCGAARSAGPRPRCRFSEVLVTLLDFPGRTNCFRSSTDSGISKASRCLRYFRGLLL